MSDDKSYHHPHLGALSTPELIREIAEDARGLLAKEIAAGKIEIQEELAHAKRAAAFGAVVLCAATATIVGLTFMLFKVLDTYTRLMEWAAFGVVAALFLALTAGAAWLAKRQSRGVNLLPDRTVREMKRDIKILREDVAH